MCVCVCVCVYCFFSACREGVYGYAVRELYELYEYLQLLWCRCMIARYSCSQCVFLISCRSICMLCIVDAVVCSLGKPFVFYVAITGKDYSMKFPWNFHEVSMEFPQYRLWYTLARLSFFFFFLLVIFWVDRLERTPFCRHRSQKFPRSFRDRGYGTRSFFCFFTSNLLIFLFFFRAWYLHSREGLAVTSYQPCPMMDDGRVVLLLFFFLFTFMLCFFVKMRLASYSPEDSRISSIRIIFELEFLWFANFVVNKDSTNKFHSIRIVFELEFLWFSNFVVNKYSTNMFHSNNIRNEFLWFANFVATKNSNKKWNIIG